MPSELGGQRLDQVAAQLFAEHSRSRLSAWIKEGRLTVDGAVIRPRDIVHGGAILDPGRETRARVFGKELRRDLIETLPAKVKRHFGSELDGLFASRGHTAR